MNILGGAGVWALSVPVLLLYVVTATLLMLVSTANQRACEAPRDGRPLPPTAVAAMSFVSNFLAVATVAIGAKALGIPTQLSLLLFPAGLVAEHYLRLIARDRRRWQVPAAGFGGSAAGMLVGGLALLRGGGHAFVSKVVAPADVQTEPIAEVLRRGDDWAISLQLLACYLVSVGAFFAVHGALVRGGRVLSRRPSQDGAGPALLAVSGFLANLAASVAVVMTARGVGVTVRQAMVLLPLFLVCESYAKILFEDAEARRIQWVGLLSSSAGMLVALFVFFRGASFQ